MKIVCMSNKYGCIIHYLQLMPYKGYSYSKQAWQKTANATDTYRPVSYYVPNFTHELFNKIVTPALNLLATLGKAYVTKVLTSLQLLTFMFSKTHWVWFV